MDFTPGGGAIRALRHRSEGQTCGSIEDPQAGRLLQPYPMR